MTSEERLVTDPDALLLLHGSDTYREVLRVPTLSPAGPRRCARSAPPARPHPSPWPYRGPRVVRSEGSAGAYVSGSVATRFLLSLGSAGV